MKNFPSYRVVPIIPAWWPYAAMAIIAWVFVKKKYVASDGSIEPLRLARHEHIHLAQQREILYLPFFALYLLEFIVRLVFNLSWSTAYKSISFEQEARAQDDFPIEQRQNYGWFHILMDDMWSRKFTILGLWVLYCAVISGAVFNHLPSLSEPQQLTLTNRVQPAYIDTISLTKIVREDETNQIAAKNLYNHRRVVITNAAVVDIVAVKFVTEGALIILAPNHEDFLYERIHATLATENDALYLQKGYVYSFEGTVSYGLTGLEFSDVELVRN